MRKQSPGHGTLDFVGWVRVAALNVVKTGKKGMLPDREKVTRNLKKSDMPILAGMQIYVRPHMVLDGKDDTVLLGEEYASLNHMYNEVSFEKTEIASVSKDGVASVEVYLRGKPSVDFIEWFRNPTSHKWLSTLNTRMCRVTGNKIVFQTMEDKVKEHSSLVKEWISNANDFARAKQLEREALEERNRKEREGLEQRRKKLQDEVNQSPQHFTNLRQILFRYY
jgi:hypothetical protein